MTNPDKLHNGPDRIGSEKPSDARYSPAERSSSMRDSDLAALGIRSEQSPRGLGYLKRSKSRGTLHAAIRAAGRRLMG
ncbi:hypothetical protein RRF57_012920 [Xylaria bambusicola]|uniref:Uncharacterized protein n=1 Tax=Xylaria bambusicola TaxID=326684 RepID=A0AAN7ZF31_9PEZI